MQLKLSHSDSQEDTSSDDHNVAVASKLGIVKLGKVAGKTKYTLLDERDIGLVHQYTFEARLDIDRNGGGARIFAVCYIYEQGRDSSVHVQDLLWRRHHGGVADGWSVVHRNCVTVDNRLENLMLVPSSMVSRWCGHVDQRHVTRGSKDQDMSLYHLAMQQLPFDPEDEYVEPLTLRYYNHHGQLVEEDDDCHTYYECRYAPCIMMEKGLREFSICGRCQQARYCGPLCQQKDWPFHKKVCREKRRPIPLFLRDNSVDR